MLFPSQVNLFQKHLFLHQLTHIMTKDCLLKYKFSKWKLQAQNMMRTCREHVVFRGAIRGKTGKNEVLPWFWKIVHGGSSGKPSCYSLILLSGGAPGLFINCSEYQNKKSICVHNMFSTCSEIATFRYWTHNTMHNMSSYCIG